MKGFSSLDYTVVLVYLVAVAGFGSSFYRRKSTASEYFLGGRSMPWLAAGISIIAADLSAITVMGTPAWAYKHNLELFWATTYPFVAPIVLLVFVPFYASLNLYTAYEYLERRFNLTVRVLASALFHVLRAMHVSIALYAPSLVISLVTGLPVWQCILLMGAITTFYTTLGGIRAVIWTDVIQFTTVMAGLVAILWTSLGRLDVSLQAAYRTASEAGRLKLLNFSTDPSELTSLWACLIGGAVLCLSPLTTDQAVLQRLFTTRSVRDCRQSVILQSIVVIPVTMLLFVVGTSLFVFYQYNPSHLSGLNSEDAILPFFAVHELPSGASGLIIASIFAASMAVMSAGINALTTATTVDFYQRLFRPHETGEHYARVGRAGTVMWGTLVTGLALFADRLGELALAYNRVSSFISGPLLGVFMLAALTMRTTAAGAIAGAAAGMVAVSLVMFNTTWSFFYTAPIGLAVTMAVGYTVSLTGTRPPPERLRGLVVGKGPSG